MPQSLLRTMSEPTCRILSVDIPALAKTGDGFQIDVRYINDGETADTFVRTLDRLGNICTRIDNPDHETGDGSLGFHTYATMPKVHYIFQLEVGYGTCMNPIEITDCRTILVTNTDLPPPNPGEMIFIPRIVWPIVCSMEYILMNGAPGQTITREGLISSKDSSAPVQKISLNIQTKDGSELGPKFTVDGETHNNSKIYEIDGGQTIILAITATLPTVMLPDKDYRFRVIVEKLEILGA